MQSDKRADQNDIGGTSTWGTKLFTGTLIVLLVFFWWLLIYSGGVTVH